jgi:hypothetical protein
MTDEQLQSLFAGIERHLDKRIDTLEQRIDARFTAFGQEVDAKLEAQETRILGEFWKWARGMEARMRMHDAINAATLERLAGIEERVLNLEKPPH